MARVEEALAQLPAVAETKQRNRSKSTPRTSTTDPDARIMKMSDGGYRPAYNIQFATDVDSHAILGVDVSNVGSDQAHLVPMLDQVEARVGRPAAWLADGGYLAYDAIEDTARRDVTLVLPVPRRRGSTDPVPPQPTDTPAILAWRARMHTDTTKQVYRIRGATAERINADTKTHRTLHSLSLRGLPKVHTWALWIALAHNLLQAMDLVPHLMTSSLG
jgi:hypothetical protein